MAIENSSFVFPLFGTNPGQLGFIIICNNFLNKGSTQFKYSFSFINVFSKVKEYIAVIMHLKKSTNILPNLVFYGQSYFTS